MTSRRASLLLVILVLAGSGTVSACGIPGRTRPVVVTDAPGLGPHNDANPEPPPGPDGAGTPLELVKRFLAAPAWGNETTEDRPHAYDDAVESARRFIIEDKPQTWQPQTKRTLRVVRIVDTGPAVPASGGEVAMKLLPLGKLGDNGKFEPSSDPDGTMLYPRFTVKQTSNGLRIENPPTDALWLSDEALRDWYEQHPIYFWDKDDKLLVPDLRYLPKVVPGARRPNEIVKWLLDTPSAWLTGSVSPVRGIELQDKLYFENGALVVNLTARAASVDTTKLTHFVHQLRWSLRPADSRIELRIGGQPIPVSPDGYLDFNPSGPSKALPEPDAFFVVGGKVQAVRGGAERSVPVLTAEQNTGIESAALARDRAALVRTDGKGRRLVLGRFDGEQGPAYTDTGLVSGTMSRPALLSLPSRRVLVAAASGKLLDVSFPDGAVRQVGMAGLGPVTAFAVAPDGRRIALVVSPAKVYLAALTFEGGVLGVWQPHLVSTQPPSEPTGLVDVTGVGWSREDWIVVAGRTGAGSALVEVTVDGARAERLVPTALESLTVTGVVALPQSPVNGSPGFVMIESNDGVYKVFSKDISRLLPSTPSPSPSGKPPAQPPRVSAPFFLTQP
jgi:Lipoprotein LpqB beta-propeller domain